MDFKIAAVNIASFEATIKDLCKKFKLEYSITYSEKFPMYKDHDITVMGFTAEVSMPEFDRLQNTGFTYLGCVKDDEAVTIHPSQFATDKKFELSSLKAEIENFPCAECGKKIQRKIIHVFENNESGEVSVYGSGCAIKKFGVDLNRLVYKFSYIMESIGGGEFDRLGGRGHEFINAAGWSKIAYWTILKTGYVSGTKAMNEEMTSTKGYTWDVYNALNDARDTSKWAKEIRQTVPAELKEIDFDFPAFVAWTKEYVAGLEDGDFSFNMVAVSGLLEDMMLSPRLSGFNAYLVFKFWYDTIRIAVEKISFNTDYSDMKEGDKIKGLKVEVIGDYAYDSMYGTQHIYTMKGLDDNKKYKWFTGNIMNVEAVYMISSCTIKQLENSEKYGKAVVITRARAKEVVNA